ncbi:MAG: ribonuclease H family protein [Lachnospiraceae bacterium]|nr:ribonuclease H family protein [Lachnospiraceae bacterium]
MAAKKYYAVKKGTTTGIFEDWASCSQAVTGFPGAVYKGFATLAEAQAYLGLEGVQETVHGETQAADYPVIPGRLLVYVDGSYNDALPRYAFGCVFLLADGEIRLACGNGDQPESLKSRNVTGEMLGAMYAVRTAMRNGYKEVELCYDYEGIEKWVTGAWKSKTDLTDKYARAMREWSQSIRILFTKVTAHTNVKYNELADETAKRGLTEANGVPKVGLLEELELYADRQKNSGA